MLNIMLAAWFGLGAFFGGEVPSGSVTACRAFQKGAAHEENDWMKYYKHIDNTISPMTWAIPISALNGPPIPPSSDR